MDENKLLEKQRIKLVLIVAIAALGVIYFKEILGILSGLLEMISPFVIGIAIAFVFYVPMKSIEEKFLVKHIHTLKYRRILSLVMMLVIVFGALTTVVLVVVPEMTDAIETLVQKTPELYDDFVNWLQPYASSWPLVEDWFSSNEIDWQNMAQEVMSFLSSGMGNVFSSTFGVVSNILVGITSLLIGIVFSTYILFEKEHLKVQAKKLIYAHLKEEKAERILKIAKITNDTFSNFLSGQVIEALILGAMFWVTLGIFGFPYALVIGLLISVTALIPIVGAFIGCAVGGFLIAVDNPQKALWFIVIFLILQQIEGNLIYPYVVGGKIGLPSIWVLMAVTLGASLMGITGIILFIPIFSVFYTLIKEETEEKIKNKKIQKRKLT